MIRKRYWRRGTGLAVLGVILVLFALIRLLQIPEICESVAFAPVTQTDSDGVSGVDNATGADANEKTALEKLIERFDSGKTDVVNAMPDVSLYASTYGMNLAGDAGQSRTGTLTAVDKGYRETYQKLINEGYWFTDAQLEGGEKVAVLDEQLAFQLFPITDPLNGNIVIGQSQYRVIGIVRHDKVAGDVDEFGLYLPLRALAANSEVALNFMALAARTNGNAGLARTLAETAKTLFGNVTSYDMSKEVMREAMFFRVLVVLFAMYALMAVLRAINQRALCAFQWVREQLCTRYFVHLLPAVLLRSLCLCALYALFLGGGYLALSLMLKPMYVFTEWVPDVIVEWSSVSGRVKELMTAAAQPVQLITALVASARLYGTLLNAGLILILCALAVRGICARKK